MIFTRRYERTVDRDNTVSFYSVIMQLERAPSGVPPWLDAIPMDKRQDNKCGQASLLTICGVPHFLGYLEVSNFDPRR